ncbi:hypothetical protein [Shewanella aestuarii]|uniref:Uncharacterized protein n=1 Tax=Shewanella aestuarii TaxID=1028752 RepID=A0A6G9QRK1_9GAMM|nr:hypothetical protein [Shewanella aestuarii]QIR16657.1 hypothetical protein HBH39_19480 [Shewanella aestuarii]
MSSDTFKSFTVCALPFEMTNAFSDEPLYAVLCYTSSNNTYPRCWTSRVDWIGRKQDLHHYTSAMGYFYDDGLSQSIASEFESSAIGFTQHIHRLMNNAVTLNDDIIAQYDLHRFNVSESIHKLASPIANQVSFTPESDTYPFRKGFSACVSSIAEVAELFSLCAVASVIESRFDCPWHFVPRVTNH